MEEYFVVSWRANGKYKEAIRIVAHDSDKRVHRTKNVLHRVASPSGEHAIEPKQPRADFWWPPIVSMHRAATAAAATKAHQNYIFFTGEHEYE